MTESVRWIVVTHAELPNGSAHRVVRALRRSGRPVGLCAVPLPGSSRFRLETASPGIPRSDKLIVRDCIVPVWQELLNLIEIAKYAFELRKTGRDPVLIVGCDPLIYFECLAIFKVIGVRSASHAVWFVDWSAQRLQRRWAGFAYKALARAAIRKAKTKAAISLPAAAAIADIGSSVHLSQILVLPNPPLVFENLKTLAWEDRPPAIVYVGGLSIQQGVNVLLDAAVVFDRMGIQMEIAGDGPLAWKVTAASDELKCMRYHGTLSDPNEIGELMARSRVGLALYDPSFEQYNYGDSLKIKDYLSAGLRIVSTSPRSADDGVISQASFDVDSIIKEALIALKNAPDIDPRSHPLLNESGDPLRTLISLMENNQ